jgi:hypothetical protein
MLIILLAGLGAGFAGYYFKVLLPRRRASVMSDYDDDEFDDDMDYTEDDGDSGFVAD